VFPSSLFRKFFRYIKTRNTLLHIIPKRVPIPSTYFPTYYHFPRFGDYGSDHDTSRSPNAPEVLPSIDDDDDPFAPEGYTRYSPDPSHRDETMRQRIHSHWLTTEDLEMTGLIKREVWDHVLHSTLLPSDMIFQTLFHYTIFYDKRKGSKFEKM
jgi:hypothetical protein